MGFKLYKFQQMAEMELHLNGAIFGGSPKNGYAISAGMQLIFAQPAAVTVTFTAGAVPGKLTFPEFKAQVEAAAALVQVTIVGDRIALVEKTPSKGVQVTASSALKALGMDSGTTTGLPYTFPDGVVPAVPPHWVTSYFASGHYCLVVKE